MNKKDIIAKCDDIIDSLIKISQPKTPVDRMKGLLGAGGWKSNVDQASGQVHFEHPQHGIVSFVQDPNSKQFQVKHAGAIAGLKGQKGTFDDHHSAIAHGLSYMEALNAGTVAPKRMANISSGSIPGSMQTNQKVGNISIPASKPNFKAQNPMNESTKGPSNIPIPNDPKLNKSNYGPKGASQYNVADNASRKASRTGDIAGSGPNKAVRSFSSKPGQLSAKQAAAAESKKAKKLSGPVKTYTPEEVAAYQQKLGKSRPEWDENEAARALSRILPPGFRSQLQPTDEQLFGHLVQPQEDLSKADDDYRNKINNWFVEASKPISARFSSPQEEQAYWDSIKIQETE